MELHGTPVLQCSPTRIHTPQSLAVLSDCRPLRRVAGGRYSNGLWLKSKQGGDPGYRSSLTLSEDLGLGLFISALTVSRTIAAGIGRRCSRDELQRMRTGPGARGLRLDHPGRGYSDGGAARDPLEPPAANADRRGGAVGWRLLRGLERGAGRCQHPTSAAGGNLFTRLLLRCWPRGFVRHASNDLVDRPTQPR